MEKIIAAMILVFFIPRPEAASISGSLRSDVVYNSLLNEYFTAYLKIDPGSSENRIMGAILNSDGTARVAEFQIAENSGICPDYTSPHDTDLKTAFHEYLNQYLVVWAHDPGDSGSPDIHGCLIDGDGTAVGPSFAVCNAADEQLEPAAAYDTKRHRFLVSWTDRRDGENYFIYGRFIESDGTMGREFLICDEEGRRNFFSALAFSPEAEQYLAVFASDRTDGPGVYGQFLDSTGNPLFTATSENRKLIGLTGVSRNAPALAYCGATGKYLVAAADNASPREVKVRLVNCDGSPEEARVIHSGGERVHAACGPAGGCLVVWDWDHGVAGDYNRIEGQLLGPELSLQGSPLVLAHNTAWNMGDVNPRIAANPFLGTFFLSYSEWNGGSAAYGLKGSLTGPAARPDPGLVWTKEVPWGASPRRGASGKTFCFAIEYISRSNSPPAAPQLWVDLDRDGEVDRSILSAPSPPATGSPWMPVLLAGFLGSVLLLFQKKRRITAAAAAAMPLFGCFLYEGTGRTTGGIDWDFSGSSELFSMDECSPEDTDFTDGKVYSFDLRIISSPGEMAYRFLFSDGISGASGYGASVRYIRID